MAVEETQGKYSCALAWINRNTPHAVHIRCCKMSSLIIKTLVLSCCLAFTSFDLAVGTRNLVSITGFR